MPPLLTIAAESEKFTAPLLFLHGLWCDANVWRRAMGYFAHRGWTCHAATLPRATATEPTMTASVDFVRSHIVRLGVPPVVIGHDLGSCLALAVTSDVRAVVAMAPLHGASVATTIEALVPRWRLALSAWRGQAVDFPSRRGPSRYRADMARLKSTMPESPTFLRSLARGAAAPELAFGVEPSERTERSPVLVVGGARDEFAPLGPLRSWATELGAEIEIVPEGGHALPWEQGWEKTMALVHRWLVRRLGEDLLVPQEEEDEDS